MKYAKLISERTIDTNVPRRAVKDGRVIVGNLTGDPELLATLGYFPLVEEPQPESAVAGYHYEARYESKDGQIVQSWEEVEDAPPPPRSLSKRRLYLALKAEGLWSGVKAYLEQSDLWEDFSLATTLDEDDPLIASAIDALKDALGLTQAQIDALLAAAAVED